MKRVPQISESEWEVLSVLWDHGPLTATQVHAELAAREWKLNTVRTFLARLETKGVVGVKGEPGARLYAHLIARETCVKAAGRSFMDRVFQGAAGSLLIHFAGSNQLSDKELSQLQEIIDRKRKGERP